MMRIGCHLAGDGIVCAPVQLASVWGQRQGEQGQGQGGVNHQGGPAASRAVLESRVTFISKKRGKQNSIFLILSVYCTQIVSFLWLWCLVLTKYLHLDKWHKISLKKTMISQENYFLLIKILSYWRFCPNYFLIFDHFWSFWHYAWKIWTNWQSCCL